MNPGDLQQMLMDAGSMTPQERNALLKQFGLDPTMLNGIGGLSGMTGGADGLPPDISALMGNPSTGDIPGLDSAGGLDALAEGGGGGMPLNVVGGAKSAIQSYTDLRNNAQNVGRSVTAAEGIDAGVKAVGSTIGGKTYEMADKVGSVIEDKTSTNYGYGTTKASVGGGALADGARYAAIGNKLLPGGVGAGVGAAVGAGMGAINALRSQKDTLTLFERAQLAAAEEQKKSDIRGYADLTTLNAMYTKKGGVLYKPSRIRPVIKPLSKRITKPITKFK